MKLSACLLPADGAALVEAVIPMLQAIEDAPDEGTRAERLAQARAWLVETAAALRKADGRGKPETPAKGHPGPAAGPSKMGPKKSPCDCDEKADADPAARPRAPETFTEPGKTLGRLLGEAFASKVFGSYLMPDPKTKGPRR